MHGGVLVEVRSADGVTERAGLDVIPFERISVLAGVILMAGIAAAGADRPVNVVGSQVCCMAGGRNAAGGRRQRLGGLGSGFHGFDGCGGLAGSDSIVWRRRVLVMGDRVPRLFGVTGQRVIGQSG